MISDVEVGSGLSHILDADTLIDQLYAALASLLDGEALDILMTAVERQGFEAWRKVSKRFDPKTKGRTRNKLLTFVSPGQCTFVDLSSSIERWEEKVRRHEERTKKPWDEDFRVASLTSMRPKVLMDHIGMNQSRPAK